MKNHIRDIKSILFVCFITFIIGCVTHCDAEFFSSIDKIEVLSYLEKDMLKAYRNYLEQQKQEFEQYRNFIESTKAIHNAAFDDVEEYTGNPINAFTLIKRVVVDWKSLQSLLNNGPAQAELRKTLDKYNQEEEAVNYDGEMRGAANGIARLQKVYNLSTSDLADGDINGFHYGSPLAWDECFEIAAILYEEKDYELAISWFEKTLAILELGTEGGEADDDDNREVVVDDAARVRERFAIKALEYLVLANYELGLLNEASENINDILATNPDHSFKSMQAYMRLQPEKPPVNVSPPYSEYPNYTRLCNGERATEKVHHKLLCKLDTKNNNPFLILTPLRKEELNADPEVNLYYNILNDKDIESILTEAGEGMHRSIVVNGTFGVVRDERISQQSWLNYTSPTMQKVYRLVSLISGYNLSNAEFMQVANYGIGGQYEPHHDFFGDTSSTEEFWKGDRLATNMFYFSDVEQGGYTVFPLANIYLKPVKGALVVWHNLHKSLDVDYRTLHAGCPVIVGSKRIGNIWIHSGLQDHARPCELQRDNYKSQGYGY